MTIHVSREGKLFGPYSSDDLQGFLAVGQLTYDDLCRINRNGSIEWTSVADVLGISRSKPPPQKRASSHWWNSVGSPTQKHFDQVANEIRERKLQEGLWTRAFADSGGDVDRARAIYIKLRAEQLASQSSLKRYGGVFAVFVVIGIFALFVAITDLSSKSAVEKPRIPTMPALTPRPYIAVTPIPKPLTSNDVGELKGVDDYSARNRPQLVLEPLEPRLALPRFTPMVFATPVSRATPSEDSYIPTTNGIIYDLYPGNQGLGRLSVENGTAHHSIAKLIDIRSNRKICSFVVRANTTGGINGIPDGTYRLIFAFGDAIIRRTDHFESASGYSAFKDTFPFVTTRTYDGSRYSEYRVTLHRVVGGNAPATSITEEEFDRY